MSDPSGWGVLWTRPLWTDELSLGFVVNQPSVAHMIGDIGRGGDWAPPLLHLVLWTLTRIFGPLGVVALRTVSLLCVAGALTFLYHTLRRRFDRVSSAAGVLAVAGHALVIAHAFEARFYGPWLLCAAGLAWSLGREGQRRRLATGAFAVLVCTIHWFGMPSLVLMCAGAVVAYGRRWREGMKLVAPSVAGVLAFVACLPLLVSQRSAATGTWVPPLNGGQVVEMARAYWLAAVPVVAAIALLASVLRKETPENTRPVPRTDPGIAALLALGLMPLFLVAVSAMMQPVMVMRYGIVAALAWAPLVALAARSLAKPLRLASVAMLVVVLGVRLSGAAAEKRVYQTRVAEFADAFAQAGMFAAPIVFTSLHTIYPVVAPARATSPWARYLDLPDSTLARLYPNEELAWLRNYFRVERDIGRSQARLFGFPTIATKSQLDTTPRFLLVATDASLPRGYKNVQVFGTLLFPNHRVIRLSGTLALFDRRLPAVTGSRTSR